MDTQQHQILLNGDLKRIPVTLTVAELLKDIGYPQKGLPSLSIVSSSHVVNKSFTLPADATVEALSRWRWLNTP